MMNARDIEARAFLLTPCGTKPFTRLRHSPMDSGTQSVNSTTLEAARLGNRKALSELLTSLQDVWFRFAMNLLRDQELAADATQETALRFMRQLPSFRGESQLKTWSLGIALNVVREMRRSRRETAETDFDAIPKGDEPGD